MEAQMRTRGNENRLVLTTDIAIFANIIPTGRFPNITQPNMLWSLMKQKMLAFHICFGEQNHDLKIPRQIWLGLVCTLLGAACLTVTLCIFIPPQQKLESNLWKADMYLVFVALEEVSELSCCSLKAASCRAAISTSHLDLRVKGKDGQNQGICWVFIETGRCVFQGFFSLDNFGCELLSENT